MVELLVFLAADYANRTENGKANVMGIFNQLFAEKFPTRYPRMYLVVKLRPGLGESGGDTRKITVKLLNQDGKEIANISGDLVIPEAKEGHIPEIDIIWEITDLIFPEPGVYHFSLLVDKDEKGTLPIYVEKTEPQGV